jgi:hypothetical protein
MKRTSSPKDMTDEALVAELKRRAPQLSDDLKKELSVALSEDSRTQIGGVLAGAAEKVTESPQLAAYREQYDSLPEAERSLCSWEELASRLAGEKLQKAEGMQGGGQLFGIDAEGKALFKDKGVEPVMYGYDKEHKMVRIYDRDRSQMWAVRKWANYFEIQRQVHWEGYELFAHDGSYGLGDEMKQAQANTKEPFVASKDRKEDRASWLESGDEPAYDLDSFYAGQAFFLPFDGSVKVLGTDPEDRGYGRIGVVRLLRV